jgi:hypothetical protein
MRCRFPILKASLLVSMVLLPGGWAAADLREPTYLVILGQPETFSAELPPCSPDSPRQVGWGVVLYTLGTPLADLRRTVEAALDTSEQTGYPLLVVHFVSSVTYWA